MNSNKSIFQISKEFEQLELMLLDSGGELTPELEEALRINREELLEKTEAYTYILAKFNNKRELIASEIKRLEALTRFYRNQCKRLEDALLIALNQFGSIIDRRSGRKAIETPFHRITTRRSTQVKVEDHTVVPDEFKVEKREVSIDKKALKRAIEGGRDVPGAKLLTKQNLSIK